MSALTWRWFWRSTRRGDYVWLWLAVILASTSVTVIEQLSRSVRATMLSELVTSMGAPLLLRSTQPISDHWKDSAEQKQIQVGELIQFNTMIAVGEQFQLVSVRAVSPYHPDQRWLSFEQGVARQLVMDSELAQTLGASVGQTLRLGTQSFSIVSLTQYQDTMTRIANQFAPPIYLPIAQVHDLGLTGAGSRINYEMSFSGSAEAIAALHQALQLEKQPSWQIVLAEKQNEDIDNTLQTAWLFLDISALTTLLIAGLAILIASQFYLQKWVQTLALLRALGVEKRQLLGVFGGQLMLLALCASMLGALLGGIGYALLQPLLHSWMPNMVVSSPWQAILLGMMSGSVIFWVFALPMFWRVMQTPPQQLFRQTAQIDRQTLWAWLLSLGLLSLVLLMLLPVHLSGWVLLGLGGVGLGLWGLAVGLQTLLFRLQPYTRGWLRLVIANLKHDPRSLKLQFIAFGLVLYLLLLMTFVHQQLISHWQATLSSDTPNVFVMNIQPDEQAAVQDLFKQYDLVPDMIPMLRARLIQHNERWLSPEALPAGRAKRLLDREANLAILSHPPAHNAIIAELEPAKRQIDLPAVSVASGIAELFAITLGDQLVFDLQGQSLRVQVTSIREVRWQSLQPNFFFIVEPWTQEALPVTYLASFYQRFDAPEIQSLKSAFKQRSGGGIWLDVQALILQVQDMMQKAGVAMSVLYVFALFASLLVVMSATLAAQENRYRQWLVLKTLGAPQATLRIVGLGEYVLIGVLSGSFAAVLAQATQMLIAVFWLKLPVVWDAQLWWVSVLTGAGSLLAMAWLSQSGRLSMTPRQLLQKVNQS